MVKPKKNLGQHFLKDHNIAKKIVAELTITENCNLLEIGPGTGILTQYLTQIENIHFKVVEIDKESVEHLISNNILPEKDILQTNFLKINLQEIFNNQVSIIGNLPYNISSQIFFSIIENRGIMKQVVCMIQKEVADRIISPPGNKTYGILSVLLQAYFNISNRFIVGPKVFHPPPKVKSTVLRLERNKTKKLNCNEELFFKVVKMAFNQRRKIISNSLKPLLEDCSTEDPIFLKRPEQLGVEEFVYLTRLLEGNY